MPPINILRSIRHTIELWLGWCVRLFEHDLMLFQVYARVNKIQVLQTPLKSLKAFNWRADKYISALKRPYARQSGP